MVTMSTTATQRDDPGPPPAGKASARFGRLMPATEPRRSTLQQERSREARRRLAHAANRLWASKGFDETSVSEICQAAGIPRANFYFYFQSKEDLLFELGLEAIEGVASATREATDGRSTDDALRTIVAAFARQAQLTPKPLLDRTIIQLMSRTERWAETRGDRPSIYRHLVRLAELAQERSEIAAGVTVDEVAQTMGAVLREGLLVWARGQVGKAKLDELLYRRLRMILNGAAVPLDQTP
jgi:AcrR family transcriptional regulator